MNVNQFTKATYSKQFIKEYENHPLIEALPPIFSKEEVVERLCNYPYFDDSERELDGQYRFHLIQRVFNLFQVLPLHLDMESRISRLLRQGYLGRNPLNPLYASSFLKGHENIMKANTDQRWINSTIPRGLTIIGPSGTGKSTAVMKILEQIPQIITHTKYNGTDFLFTQLVFLRLECSFDGSVKGLVNQFFIAVDVLLGTNYFEKYGQSNKLSVNTLMPIMTQVCRSIGLGLLVVDEIQHLSVKGYGSKQMLNFFTVLSNIIGSPLVLIGTPSAMNVLQREFRQARRGSGQGDIVFDRMANDDYWRLFLESIWGYQWVKKPIELSEEMSNVLYEESTGILDICLKIWALAQIKAISTGQEIITVPLIRRVAQENLKLVQPMLKAIKSGDINKMAQYEDIYLPMEKLIEKERIDLEKNTFIQATKNQKKTHDAKQVREEAQFRLNLLGISKEKAKKVVSAVLNEESILDVQELVQKAYKRSFQLIEEHKEEKEPRIVSQKDLREIVRNGKDKGLSAYDSLKHTGVIREIKEVG